MFDRAGYECLTISFTQHKTPTFTNKQNCLEYSRNSHREKGHLPMSENIWKTSCFNPIQRKSQNTASHAGMRDIQWE